MEIIKDIDSLTIREKKEYTGIPSSWNIKPEFCLSDSSEKEILYAVSEKGEWKGFDYLRDAKTYTLYVVNQNGDEVFFFKKQFGLLSNKASIFNSDEDLIGEVQKSSKAVKTIYEVGEKAGRFSYQVEGPAVKPEVFHIYQNNIAVGRLSKKPGKNLEEGVSRQAHFGIVFPMGCGLNEKAALLGALLLIDLLN